MRRAAGRPPSTGPRRASCTRRTARTGTPSTSPRRASPTCCGSTAPPPRTPARSPSATTTSRSPPPSPPARSSTSTSSAADRPGAGVRHPSGARPATGRGRGTRRRARPLVRGEPLRGVRRVAARGELLAGAAGQDLLHRGLLGAGDPQPVLLLHGHLPGDVRAAVLLVRREPGRRVAVALAAVGTGADGGEVER